MPKRKSYTADFKLSAIEFAKVHGNREAGRTFAVDEKCIRVWRKNEDNLQEMNPRKRARRGKPAKWPNLETNLKEWVLSQREACSVVSTRSIQRQARYLALVRQEWDKWMREGKHSYTPAGKQRRASYSEVCKWDESAWKAVKTTTIIRGFVKALEKDNDSPDDDSTDDEDYEFNDEEADAFAAEHFADTDGDTDFEGFSSDDIPVDTDDNSDNEGDRHAVDNDSIKKNQPISAYFKPSASES